MHLSSKDKPWGKPFTFKRYIHPPLAENLVTMWPSSMILFGETLGGAGSHVMLNGRGHMSALPSTAVIFTLNGKFLPWTKVKYSTRKDGLPIHSFSHLVDGVKFSQEAFCDTEKLPTAYIKVTLQNTTDSDLSFDFGAMVRSGPEFDLVGGDEPDGYRWFEQLKKQWMTMPTFIRQSGKLTNGTFTLRFSKTYDFIEKDFDDLSTNLTLKASERKTYLFTLTRNKDKKPLSYTKAKNDCEKFWLSELSKAERKPVNMKKGFFNNLICQTLQMICYPKGENYVLFRQGGIERVVYPKEAEPLFRAIAYVGGYDDYLDKVLDMYFNVLQVKEGENKGQVNTFGMQWSSLSAAAIQSYSYVALNNESIFKKYYNDALDSFRWIEKKRAGTKLDPNLIPGLFPPWVSSDFGDAEQVWSLTDKWNIEGYREFKKVADKYNTAEKEEITTALNDYLDCIKARFFELSKEAEGKDEWIVPRDARNDPEIEKKLDRQFEFCSYCKTFHQAHWLNLGIAGYGTPLANKIYKNIEREVGADIKRHGHFMPMSRSHKKGGSTFSPPVGQRWYTNTSEYEMFDYFYQLNDKKMMKIILDGQFKYATSNEGYMVERFCDHNAFWCPWQPNASANGRLITMSFILYGEEKL
ncbi:MAG: hypothetical protein E7382_02310 [Clostridiales bacterium]|nr:hypothetical protein [Clostridiales bacterium]